MAQVAFVALLESLGLTGPQRAAVLGALRTLGVGAA
jgi:hypothetical protein